MFKLTLLCILIISSLNALADQTLDTITNYVKKQKSKQTLNILYPKGSRANLEPITKLFTKLTQVKVELIEGSLSGIGSELILNEKINIQPRSIDIALPSTFAIPDLVRNDVIYPLDEFKSKYPKLSEKSLYETGDYYKGKRYGFQTDGDTMLLFLRKDWLENKKNKKSYQEEYKQELKVPTTWKELDQQISFFHKPEQNQFGSLMFRNKDYISWEFLLRLHSKGVLPVDDKMKPLFNTEAGISALKELISLKKYSHPDIHKIGLFKNFDLYKKGLAYANLGWGGSQKSFNSKDSKIINKITYALIPGGSINGTKFSLPYFNWGWSYIIAKNSRNKDLAYLFIQFATTPTASTLAIREASGYFDPFLSHHYNDKEIQKIYTKEFLDIHQKSMNQSIPDFYIENRSQYFSVLQQAIYAASLDQISPKLALDKAAAKWEEITEKIGRKKQIKQWKLLRKFYPSNLKKLMNIDE